MRIKHLFLKIWPFFIIASLVSVFFWKFFLKGLVPIPTDFIVGTYFPWLDYKWGYVVGVPVKNPILSDVVSVIYPIKIYAMELIKKRILPLWFPRMFAGYPLLTNFQIAVFNPTNIFYLFLPNSLAWSLQIFFQPLLVGIFTFIFLNHLKISKNASIFGAIIFAFSGFCLIWLEWNTLTFTAAFLPILLFLTNNFFTKRKIYWGILISLALALQIFSGYPQTVFYTIFALVTFIFFQHRVIQKKTFFWCLWILLGVGLAAIQVFPAGELLLNSQRQQEILSREFAFLPWQNLISFFAPDYFGNHATGNFWGKVNYTNNSGYTGVITFILATVAVGFLKKRKIVRFFIFLFLSSLLFCLPNPISIFMNKIKFLGLSAMAAHRALFLANFSLACLAAFVFDSLSKKRGNLNNIRAAYLPLIILLGIFLGTFAAYKNLTSLAELANDPFSIKILNQWLTNLKVGLRNLILPLGLTFCTVFIFILINFKIKFLRNLALLALFLLTVFELFRFGWKYTPFAKKELLFPKTPVIDFLISQEKPFRILGGGVIPMNMWSAFELESPAGYDAVYPLRYAQFVNVLNGGQVEDSVGRYGDIQRFDTPLIDLANSKYILALKYDKSGSVDKEGNVSYKFQLPKLKPVFEDRSVVVLENTSALPRAFLVYDYQIETDKRKIFDVLLGPKFNFKKKIVLEEKISNSLKIGEIKQVKYLGEINGESRILVNHEGEGLLFVSDSYYPGWKAYVDGQETKIYRANYTFRAVFVPEGEHEIKFLFQPQSFKIGAGISIFILVVLIGLFLNETIRSRYYSPKRSS
jgi:hypothetical protein